MRRRASNRANLYCHTKIRKFQIHHNDRYTMRRTRQRNLPALTALTARTDIPGMMQTPSRSNLSPEQPASPLADDSIIVPKPSVATTRAQRRTQRREQLQAANRLNIKPDTERVDAGLPLAQPVPQPVSGSNTSTSKASIDNNKEQQSSSASPEKTAPQRSVPQLDESALRRSPLPTAADSPNASQSEDRLLRGKRSKKGTRSTRFDKEDRLNLSQRSTHHEDIPFFTSPIKDEPDAAASLPPSPLKKSAPSLFQDPDIQAEAVAPEDAQTAPQEPEQEVRLDDQLTMVDHLGHIIDGGDIWGHVNALTSDLAGTEYTPYQKRVYSEHQCLYEIAPTDPVPLHVNPTGPASHPDDGLFVGASVPSLPSRLHNFEFRVAKEQHAHFNHWFTADGDVVRLPNPLKDVPMRPEPIADAQQIHWLKKSAVAFLPAAIDTTALQALAFDRGLKDQPYLLQIAVQSLQFTNHPLFLEEHHLAFKLRGLCKQVCPFASS